MKRLGKYTGKIYSDEEKSEIRECCLCISDEQAENEEFVKQRHFDDLRTCVLCGGCPEAGVGKVEQTPNTTKTVEDGKPKTEFCVWMYKYHERYIVEDAVQMYNKNFGKNRLYTNYGDGSISVFTKDETVDPNDFFSVLDDIRKMKWCVTTSSYECLTNEGVHYLGWQEPSDVDEDTSYDLAGYFWTTEEVIESIMDNSTHRHPFIFDTKTEAILQVKKLKLPQKCKIELWSDERGE